MNNAHRVGMLEQAVTALLDNRLNETLRQQAERAAHLLAASLEARGNHQGALLAREVEQQLRPGVGLAQGLRLSEQVLALVHLVGESPNSGDSNAAMPEHLPEQARLLLVDRDANFADQLVETAATRGLTVDVLTEPDGIAAVLKRQIPDLALIDLPTAGVDEGDLSVLEYLTEHAPPIPFLAFATEDRLAQRVQVVRLGARGFLHKPTTPERVLDIALRVLDKVGIGHASVLAVDDDPYVLEMMRILFDTQAIRLHALSDPQRFWDTLHEVRPDLLVLDLDMPDYNGLELCRVVRHDPYWHDLPILFLTGSNDAITRERVFVAGADDFVAKPIAGGELTARVANRLDRVRTLRAAAETDPVTGLANQYKARRELQHLLRLAEDRNGTLILAVLRLDRFGVFQEQHGRLRTHVLLNRISDLLRQRVRDDDLFSYWGEGEFVVAWHDTADALVRTTVSGLLTAVSRETLSGPEGELPPVTASVGIASWPDDGRTLTHLYMTADQRCRKVKAEGGGHYLSGEQTGLDAQPDVVIVDSDVMLVELVYPSLRARGLRVQALQDGPTAIKRLAGDRPALRPRLIMLDINLPGVNGLAVLRRLARDRVLARSRVLMLTARAVETEILQALDLGAAEYIVKPFSLPVLLRRVQRLLGEPVDGR